MLNESERYRVTTHGLLQDIQNRNEVTIKSDMSYRLDWWFEMVIRHVEINCMCLYIPFVLICFALNNMHDIAMICFPL